MGNALVKEISSHQKKEELNLASRGLKAIPNVLGKCVRLKRLDISGNELADLPEELSKLVELKVLTFSKNNITYFSPTLPPSLEEVYASGNRLFYVPIPPKISSLVNLRVLDLSSNQLEEIPAEIGQIQTLETVILYSNDLKVFPPGLYQLSSLKLLNMNHNKIREIGPEIADLKTLAELHMEFNQLTKLPENIGKAGSLIRLLLGNNFIKSIPLSFGDLAQLQELDIKENHELYEFPLSLARLKSLRRLDISNSKIEGIPISLKNWTEMTELILRENGQIEDMPGIIGNLKVLKKLDAFACSLKGLPDEIGELTELSWLDLRKNHITALGIPSTISQLQALSKLFLSNNDLDALPEELCQLSQLQELDVSSNLIAALPEGIGNLGALEKLFVNGNSLEALPASIKNLKKLSVLELRSNKLRSLPADIGELVALTRLDITHNQLNDLPVSMSMLKDSMTLELKDNPFDNPPQNIIVQGTAVIFGYLREQASNKTPGGELPTVLPLPPPATVGQRSGSDKGTHPHQHRPWVLARCDPEPVSQPSSALILAALSDKTSFHNPLLWLRRGVSPSNRSSSPTISTDDIDELHGELDAPTSSYNGSPLSPSTPNLDVVHESSYLTFPPPNPNKRDHKRSLSSLASSFFGRKGTPPARSTLSNSIVDISENFQMPAQDRLEPWMPFPLSPPPPAKIEPPISLSDGAPHSPEPLAIPLPSHLINSPRLAPSERTDSPDIPHVIQLEDSLAAIEASIASGTVHPGTASDLAENGITPAHYDTIYHSLMEQRRFARPVPLNFITAVLIHGWKREGLMTDHPDGEEG
ncbi:uncharacterized protein BJ171DRAFT_577183 [Polychytrium aggregatum]|uniref:uncharacterized protein n=1 Tax=Polychytrium aggregatum TaxID=110093 RepID=UPI0022FEBC55|nr:uncharacterized protein BJ171DRAFT_577183 [Polychytrium aggregatum]KAI9208832.1 hypothetical protein BJ171DRAFT_577183 [Polychytrium aggregatum]